MRRFGVLLLALLSMFFLSSSVFAAENNTIKINNVYFKGDGKYEVVVYSSNKDTLQMYVNDQNPVKAKVNKEGWATFKKVKLTGQSKLSFAKKVGWYKYYPVDYVKHISVDNERVNLIDDGVIAAQEAKAQAEAQAKHKVYIDGLASAYCSNHQGNRSIYIPQTTSRDVWEKPNKDLVTKNPKQSNCVTVMTFFADTMKSKYLDKITSFKVETGMNRAEVLAAWGWPNNNSDFSSDWGSSGTWRWNTGTCYRGVCPHQQYVTFVNGKVDGIGNY